jgi:ACS family D-galactonate transporter-like MFS transporter
MSDLSPAPKPTNVRWVIVAMLVGLAFLAQFNRYNISVVGDERWIGPDKLSKEQVGMIYSALLLVYTICMIPGGWLIDRIGPKRALTGMGLGLGLCVILTGALGWLGLTITAMWVPLLLIRGLAGAASAPLHPGAARSASLWIPLGGRSTANGLITAGALIGIALSYPGFGWLLDRADWPWGFVICGGALMAFALVWNAVASDAPTGHPWTNPAERQLIAGAAAPRTTATFRDALRLFRNRNLLLLTLSYGALGYVQYMYFYWMKTYFGEVLHLSVAETRQAAFTVTIAMAVGMAGGGWVSDLLCRRLGFCWGSRSIALAGMGLSAGFSLLGISMTDPDAVVLCFALAMGALGLCEGIFWTMAPALEPRNGGLAAAVLNTGGNGIGLLAPVFTPLLADAFGWNSAVVVACVICGVGALLWLCITPPPAPAADAPEETDPSW